MADTRGRGRPAVGPRIQVRLPEEITAEVDAYAESYGISRAEAIRLAVEEFLGRRRIPQRASTR